MIRTSGDSSINSIETSSSFVILGIGIGGKATIDGKMPDIAAGIGMDGRATTDGKMPEIAAGNSSMVISGTSEAADEAAAGADSPAGADSLAIPPTAPASRRSTAFWSRRRPSALSARCCSMRLRHSGL